MFFLSSIADVYKLSTWAYVLGALMATMMALMGAFVGNVLKGDRPNKPAPSASHSRQGELGVSRDIDSTAGPPRTR